MNKDQVKSTLAKAKGSVKETVGKAVGNEKLQAEGSADKWQEQFRRRSAMSRTL